MKRLIAVLLAVLFTLPMLTACNTLEGAGEDVERAGEGIQEGVNQNR